MDKTPQSGYKQLVEKYDLVVAGGGMAGLCCAIQGARSGLKTCLVHDRPVLGGVSSSEMRVTVHGAAARHAYARETGILSEIMIEERCRNHESINENGWTNSVWDMTLYDWVMKEELLTLKLNTNVIDVMMANGTLASENQDKQVDVDFSRGYGHRHACPLTDSISSLIAVVGNSQTKIQLQGKQFVDCTGDAIIADMAGCEWRWGSESKEETGEYHAPNQASTDVMGNSIHIKARDMGREVPYDAPDWAVKHEDASYFYEQGRAPDDARGGFWWIEIGVPYNTLYDNEEIRHELTRHALGVWDWMKNKDPKMKEECKNYALEFIGQVPGKRENRRVMGQYLLTEHDIWNKVEFEDEIAFGGWFLDLHTPGGLLAESSEPEAAEGYKNDSEYAVRSHVGPYGIPLRSLLSKDIKNLAMAGRNVSVTHAALGTVRVMATTSLMGQGLGMAIAVAQSKGLDLGQLNSEHFGEIKQNLLRAGCFLPSCKRNDTQDLAMVAKASASSTRVCVGNVDEKLRMSLEDTGYGDCNVNLNNGDLCLDKEYLQLIPVDGSTIHELSFECKSNSEQKVSLNIYKPTHIWDYDLDNSKVLCQSQLTVTPDKSLHSVELNLDLKGKAGFLRVCFGKNEKVHVKTQSLPIPGANIHMRTSPDRTALCHRGSMSFKVSPAQKVFEADHVCCGATRPYLQTHTWMSSPEESLPQSLMLEWDHVVKVYRVELTFPGHLLKEYHATLPLSKDKAIPKDFILEGEREGKWTPLAKVKNNYQRKVSVQISKVEITRLRIKVLTTNGSPMAQIAEVRVYE